MKKEKRIDFDAMSDKDVENKYNLLMKRYKKNGLIAYSNTIATHKKVTKIGVMRDILKMQDSYEHGEYTDITKEKL